MNVSGGERLVGRIRPIALKTARPGLLAGVGGFSALFELKRGRYRNPVLVSSTDGVGTKLKLAFMTGVHDTVGIDLVAMGVNDILTQGAEPLFFLDYMVWGRLNVDVAEAVIRGIAEGCRRAGCVLIGGETAEHPGDYPAGEYDLAGFAVGAVEREKILKPAAIVPGDVLIGLPSSGLHSNGYSLARKVVFEIRKYKPRDRIPDLGRTIGEEMLEPTRIYATIVRALLRGGRVKGIAHITGGGISGNLPRVFPEGRRAWIRRGSWRAPPIFGLIQKWGDLSDREMERTFNNGLGMILVAARDDLSRLEGVLRRAREDYAIIGEVRKGEKGVTFTS